MPYPARITAVFVATVATLAFAQRAPARQVATLDAVRAATSRDDAFLRINANYPGFAGIHLESGRAVISSTAASGKADLAELLSLGGELDLDVGELSTREVEFEFTELNKLRDQLMPALAWGGGAHALDVDERTNRVTVYVRDENERLVVTELMLRHAARFEAVTFVTQSPASATADLRSQFRPVPGGVQIGKENFAVCTNGWSVLMWGIFNTSNFIFSHWTNVQDELGSLNYLP